MKIYLLILALFNYSMGVAQDDTYKLYKDGESYKKPIYYLSEKDFESIREIEGNTVFLTKFKGFKHDPEKHEFYELRNEEAGKIDLVKPESLYKYEEQEFNNRANEVEKKIGFRPVPPLTHYLLKILILRKINNCYFLYEVDWEI